MEIGSRIFSPGPLKHVGRANGRCTLSSTGRELWSRRPCLLLIADKYNFFMSTLRMLIKNFQGQE